MTVPGRRNRHAGRCCLRRAISVLSSAALAFGNCKQIPDGRFSYESDFEAEVYVATRVGATREERVERER